MKKTHRLVGLFLVGALGIVACAEGTSSDVGAGGAEPKRSKEATEPDPPSQTLQPPSGGGSSSGASSSGASSSGASSSGSSGATTDGGDAGASSSSSSGGVDAGGPACTTTPPTNACGLVPQCGCAANETCDVTNKSNGGVGCMLAGGGPQGSLCTTTNQCQLGLTCAYGACRPYCATANTACTGTGVGQCGQYYDPPGTAVPNALVCTIACDLRNPSAACGSNTCIWDSSVSATDCDKAGAKDMWDACTSYNDCKQGMACINHPTFGYECEKWCRVGTASDCGAYETCADVYGASAPMEGGTKLGHCQ